MALQVDTSTQGCLQMVFVFPQEKLPTGNELVCNHPGRIWFQTRPTVAYKWYMVCQYHHSDARNILRLEPSSEQHVRGKSSKPFMSSCVVHRVQLFPAWCSCHEYLRRGYPASSISDDRKFCEVVASWAWFFSIACYVGCRSNHCLGIAKSFFAVLATGSSKRVAIVPR